MGSVVIGRGMLGFDCNVPLHFKTVVAFADHGYAFVVRYVGRMKQMPNDLSPDEVDAIRAGGLGLMVVQHFESESGWKPSASKGSLYGQSAAYRCVQLGLAPRTCLWLDLESVAEGTVSDDIIGYANAWYNAVSMSGFTPSLYVGWNNGLTPEQLYHDLGFEHYWSSYNLNLDQHPAVRGVQMRQRAATREKDYPDGIAFDIDVNTVTGDAKNGFPIMDYSAHVVL